MILANSFSINMVKHHVSVNINFSTIGVEQAAQLIDELNCELAGSGECLVNAIGHPDLDNIARQQLVGVNPLLEIPPGKRLNVMLGPDLDTSHRMLVAQYRGPRLPEGASVLPEGAEIEWWLVTAIAEEN